jgi:hypothetical protein
MLCDRGRTAWFTVDKAVRRTFLVPEYTPLILLRPDVEDRIEVLEAIPLVGASGRPVTGLSNLEGTTSPLRRDGTKRLAFNQERLDTEGLAARAPEGSGWPTNTGRRWSMPMRAGKVLARYVRAA